MSQMRELTDEVAGATELGVLQTLVNARLERVAQHVSNFRAREEFGCWKSMDAPSACACASPSWSAKPATCIRDWTAKSKARASTPLTGIANRKVDSKSGSRTRSRRSRVPRLPVAMLLWDLDNFKVVNDSYGHRAGDRVLQSVAACFMAAVRGNDFVARIGGEEFVMLLSGAKIEQAMLIANQVRSAVEALRFHFRGTPVRVTVSCGVTELKEDDVERSGFRSRGRSLVPREARRQESHVWPRNARAPRPVNRYLTHFLRFRR